MGKHRNWSGHWVKAGFSFEPPLLPLHNYATTQAGSDAANAWPNGEPWASGSNECRIGSPKRRKNVICSSLFVQQNSVTTHPIHKNSAIHSAIFAIHAVDFLQHLSALRVAFVKLWWFQLTWNVEVS